jgi:hypothetical protein
MRLVALGPVAGWRAGGLGVPRSSAFPQLNWTVAGPLIVVLALIIGISGFIVSLSVAGTGFGSSGNEVATDGGYVPGTGGGVDLRPPPLVRSQLFSLSARVVGSPTIRRGPGTQYAVVRTAAEGQEFHVIACSPGCEWLRVFSLSDDGQWWLPSTFLNVSGKVEELPILTPVDAVGR